MTRCKIADGRRAKPGSALQAKLTAELPASPECRV